MKRRIGTYLMIGLFVLTNLNTIYSQDNNYPIEIINNKEYYQYRIKSGESLYSISRAFNVSQQSINSLNPHIADGLKAGQTILIPIMKKEEDSAAKLKENYNYIEHKVEPRQTLFAISRKYNISQDDIVLSNPIVKGGLKAGTILQIPVKNNDTAELKTETTTETSGADSYFLHTVKAKETLFSLSREYGIHVKEIIAINPQSVESLQIGEKIKIPTKATKKQDSNQSEVKDVIKTANKVKYKVAYLLPFMSNSTSVDPTSERFIEFYLGSLLALNNAKNRSIEYDVYAFDVEKTETKLHEIINQPEMQDMDLIIGPAYTNQIAIISDFSKRHRINTVIPFSSKVAEIDNNPYLIQFNPDQDKQLNFLANSIKNRFRFYTITMVKTDSKDRSYYNDLKNKFDQNEIKYREINAKDLESNLDASTNNLLFFDSENFNKLKSYLDKLNKLESQYSVTVFGQYSWRVEEGSRPKMIYISPFVGSSSSTQYYEEQFKKFYKRESKSENPRFDILGYDLSNFFFTTMTENGFSFDTNTQNLNFNAGVQSNFSFIRENQNGGLINTRMYLIEEDAK